jgi:hypothetical protein
MEDSWPSESPGGEGKTSWTFLEPQQWAVSCALELLPYLQIGDDSTIQYEVAGT